VLIDEFLPQWDVRERHGLRVRAAPSTTYEALRSTDLASSSVVRLLLLLRALPGALRRARGGLASLRRETTAPTTLRTFERHGFRILAERPPHELLIGLEGKFWTVKGALCTPSAEAFRSRPPEPGTARAAWNFSLVPAPDGGTTLRTETRVQCADAGARRRFLPYWYAIRPASGMIRRGMLQSIRRTAEGSAV
jgi:hypothetical protein